MSVRPVSWFMGLCLALLAGAGCSKSEDSTPGAKPAIADDAAIAAIDAFIAQQKIDKSMPTWRTTLPMPPKVAFTAGRTYFWVLETSKGTMKLRLMQDVAPMHCSSTIYLTRLGFYDGLTFHRDVKGFMVQGGDPLGNGTGSPGYGYGGEFDRNARHDKRGILSMAHTPQPNSDGSQFFITFAPTPMLDDEHTVFGELVDGMPVLKAIEDLGGQGNFPAPKEPIAITRATIVVE